MARWFTQLIHAIDSYKMEGQACPEVCMMHANRQTNRQNAKNQPDNEYAFAGVQVYQ